MLPPPPSLTRRRLARALPLLALALLPLAGCDKDEVRTYQAPHEASAPVEEEAPRARVLAAIVPHGDDAWIFKVAGPSDVVDGVEDTFKTFLRGVTFEDKGNPPITWKVPAGWRQEEGPEPRFATLRPDALDGLELTVSKLPAKGGALMPNINRWRRLDLGLGPTRGGLDQLAERTEVGGEPATLVDMTGPGVRKLEPPFTYKAPEGWKDTGGRGGAVPVDASFRAGAAEVTVIGLPTAGGLLANLNRWRAQLGLDPITQKELDLEKTGSVKVDGQDCKVVDLIGKPGAGQRRLIVALVPRAKRIWYFKILGPVEAVGKEKSAFEAFVKSVKFTGASE
jgi:hypothetical protein